MMSFAFFSNSIIKISGFTDKDYNEVRNAISSLFKNLKFKPTRYKVAFVKK
ncbi:hypothetical protein R3W88_003580 [Solanum pinnatisectum]|uniref:Uncharacterized protein n=1 Tax=Solanum pinnatisectum TaxID=50273 RepID=A0AAV9MPF1_9SOLN|nr:hypothetical protein R3W88_003580 [Solanum pinnatisectum]